MTITICQERITDINTIFTLTETAFHDMVYSSHTEQFIVNALRRSGQLAVSLVAVDGEEIVGHVAVSPVALSSGADGWYVLGPISVWPARQRQGIGSQLMYAALESLRQQGAAGCVVVGDPAYYGRFGFRGHAALSMPGIPSEYLMAIALQGELPHGEVIHHDAFNATE